MVLNYRCFIAKPDDFDPYLYWAERYYNEYKSEFPGIDVPHVQCIEPEMLQLLNAITSQDKLLLLVGHGNVEHGFVYGKHKGSFIVHHGKGEASFQYQILVHLYMASLIRASLQRCTHAGSLANASYLLGLCLHSLDTSSPEAASYSISRVALASSIKKGRKALETMGSSDKERVNAVLELASVLTNAFSKNFAMPAASVVKYCDALVRVHKVGIVHVEIRACNIGASISICEIIRVFFGAKTLRAPIEQSSFGGAEIIVKSQERFRKLIRLATEKRERERSPRNARHVRVSGKESSNEVFVYTSSANNSCIIFSEGGAAPVRAFLSRRLGVKPPGDLGKRVASNEQLPIQWIGRSAIPLAYPGEKRFESLLQIVP